MGFWNCMTNQVADRKFLDFVPKSVDFLRVLGT